MKYTFKTNINCGGCVAAVTPHLNADKNIKHWEVDTQSPQKLLTVEADDMNRETIKDVVSKAGFKAEALEN